MSYSTVNSHYARIWCQFGLAIMLALALAASAHAFPIMASSNNQAQGCEVNSPEMCLRWGPDYASKNIPVTGIRSHSDFSNNQSEGCEGNNQEICLQWGPDHATKNIPVTGSSNHSDFGYYYWLMVGPAGESPVGNDLPIQ